MDINNGKPSFSFVATSETSIQKNNVSKPTARLENIQIGFWKEAKNIYFTRINNGSAPTVTNAVILIVLLINSLTFLFAREYKTKGGKTPELVEMMKGLRKEHKTTFRKFEEIWHLYRNIIKHPDIEKYDDIKKDITTEKCRNYMKVVKEIWIWYIDHYYLSNSQSVPEDQIEEFRDIFD